MLKDIFFPEFFKNKRVYSQKILSFYLEDTSVSCIKLTANRNNTIITKTIKKNFQFLNKNTSSVKIANIKKIKKEMGNFDQAYITILSKLIIFKELELPFIDSNKIRMVLDYEIEPKLPFSIEEAILDFMIIYQDKIKKRTKLLVAVARIKDITEILEIYNEAGIDPTKITLDLFSIFNIYTKIPEYSKSKGSTAIVDIGESSSRIALIENNTIKITRVITKGIDNIINNIQKDTNLTLNEIKKNINKFGLSISNNEKYDKALQKNAIAFFNEIQFSLNSFSLQLNLNKAIGKILFTGSYSNLKKLTIFCKKLLQIKSEIFDSKKIFDNKQFINKTGNSNIDWNKFIVPLGTAITSEKLLNFNLRRKSLSQNKSNLIRKQLKMAISLTILIFGAIFVIGAMQTYKLSNKINLLEANETKKLLSIIPKNSRIPKKISFIALINKAKKAISEKLEVWGPFEDQKLKPLYILEQLTTIMDRKKFDVTTELLSISEENKRVKIELEGIFRSKTGSDHFKYFAELEKRFEDSKVFELWNRQEGIESRLEEDRGIRFSAKLKLKE